MEYCSGRGEVPPRAVFLQDYKSEVESNGKHGEAPTRCVIMVSLRGLQSWWFHFVRWSVVLQLHYDEGSCMTVVFLVRCALFSYGSLLSQDHAGRFSMTTREYDCWWTLR